MLKEKGLAQFMRNCLTEPFFLMNDFLQIRTRLA
jgi:hypothetical protein